MKTNPNNYDAWFDYLRLMESEAEPDAVREVYERAIANVPPAEEKRLWRRYIYLWINYALYEELIAKVNRNRVFSEPFYLNLILTEIVLSLSLYFYYSCFLGHGVHKASVSSLFGSYTTQKGTKQLQTDVML